VSWCKKKSVMESHFSVDERLEDDEESDGVGGRATFGANVGLPQVCV